MATIEKTRCAEVTGALNAAALAGAPDAAAGSVTVPVYLLARKLLSWGLDDGGSFLARLRFLSLLVLSLSKGRRATT
jgi:hypothetical protein